MEYARICFDFIYWNHIWLSCDSISIKFRANKVDDLTLFFIGAISNKIEYWFLKFERNWKYNWNINKIE